MMTNQNANAAQRLLLYMEKHEPGARLCALLRTFAAAGDVEILQGALDGGVVGRASAAGTPIFSVIVPLAASGQAPDVVKEIMDRWQSACGPLTQQQLDEALSSTNDPHCATDLIALGASPNGLLDHGPDEGRTALAVAIRRGRTRIVEIMLEALVKTGEIPLYRINRTPEGATLRETLFDQLASVLPGAEVGLSEKIAVMDLLLDSGVPRLWADEMGKAILLSTAERPYDADIIYTEIVPRLLALASFERKEQWYKIIELNEKVIEAILRDTRTHVHVMMAVERAVDDGAEIDEIPSFVKSRTNHLALGEVESYTKVTLLQSAVVYGVASLAKFLIEKGASIDPAMPNAETLPKTLRGKTLLELAALLDDKGIEQALLAARARRSINNVLAQASQRPSSTSP